MEQQQHEQQQHGQQHWQHHWQGAPLVQTMTGTTVDSFHDAQSSLGGHSRTSAELPSTASTVLNTPTLTPRLQSLQALSDDGAGGSTSSKSSLKAPKFMTPPRLPSPLADLPFNPADITAQPVDCGVADLFLPTSPPQRVRVYSLATDRCVVDYPSDAADDWVNHYIAVAATYHNTNLGLAQQAAAILRSWTHDAGGPPAEPPAAERERARTDFDPRLLHAQPFKPRDVSSLPRLVRRATGVLALDAPLRPGLRPVTMDFGRQTVDLDQNANDDERELVALLVVVLGRTEGQEGVPAVNEKAREEHSKGCGCVIM